MPVIQEQAEEPTAPMPEAVIATQETGDDLENFDANESDDENIYPSSSQDEYCTEHETESDIIVGYLKKLVPT